MKAYLDTEHPESIYITREGGLTLFHNELRRSACYCAHSFATFSYACNAYKGGHSEISESGIAVAVDKDVWLRAIDSEEGLPGGNKDDEPLEHRRGRSLLRADIQSLGRSGRAIEQNRWWCGQQDTNWLKTYQSI